MKCPSLGRLCYECVCVSSGFVITSDSGFSLAGVDDFFPFPLPDVGGFCTINKFHTLKPL